MRVAECLYIEQSFLSEAYTSALQRVRKVRQQPHRPRSRRNDREPCRRPTSVMGNPLRAIQHRKNRRQVNYSFSSAFPFLTATQNV